MNLPAWLRPRYVRYLEDEVQRLRGQVDYLRAENGALRDSVLGIAGVLPIEPVIQARLKRPIDPAATSRPAPKSRLRPTWQQARARLEAQDAKEAEEIRKNNLAVILKHQEEQGRAKG
jgi:hypothetical protein